MNFLAQKLVSAALLPSALMIECLLAGLLLRRLWLGRALVWLGALAGLAFLLLPVDSWALRPLEDRFPPMTQPPDRVDGVVMLGGAVDDVTSNDRDVPVLDDAANRVTTFVALARRYPAARMVFTGGSPPLAGGRTEASFTRDLLTSLGLPPDRVTYEGKSLTTMENAIFTRDLVHPAPGEVWLLVTSASHMPRSVGVFREAGWPVLAYPTGYHSRTGIFPWSRAFGAKLGLLDTAAHEWTGLVQYWATGKISTLFPAP